MPVQLSYPGVYIEELPSGVHTIVGVPTSVTAFVGRAAKGPVNAPTTCFSFGDYVRFFGAPGHDDSQTPYAMSYAVEDFFLNGGGQAIIVRVVEEAAPATSGGTSGGSSSSSSSSSSSTSSSSSSSTSTAAAAATEQGGTGLKLVAASPGAWGNQLLAWVDYTGLTKPSANQTGAPFNLNIQLLDPTNPVTERFINLSTAAGAGPKRVDYVLAAQSMLARVSSDYKFSGAAPSASAPPSPPKPTFSGGTNGGTLTAGMATGSPGDRSGIYALMETDIFNILCIPLEDPESEDNFKPTYQAAAEFCVDRRAMLVMDGPEAWTNDVKQQNFNGIDPGGYFSFTEAQERNAAVYVPRIQRVDDATGQPGIFSAVGAIAGQWAATDTNRGVWKAPAGIETALGGIAGLELRMSDGDNGQLNPIGVNCLRSFPILGSVIWGARTLRGADIMEDDYKYVPVRRLTLFIEESLVRGTKWAVFEPNDETLWASLRTSIGSFMADLSKQGAFYDYQVICDKTTTTASDIAQGVVNVIVAFAPVKPAEFVVLKIQQEAGQAPG